MGRIYTASFVDVAITLAQDLFEIVAPATAIVKIHEYTISQKSDVGDVAEEGLVIALKTGATTGGSGGSAPAVVKNEQLDAAFSGTVEANNTTKATAGTIVTRRNEAWNIRTPLSIIFTPEMRPVLAPSARLTLELVTAPTDPVTVSGTITFEEIG